jgi:Domain of unknown function (DUF1917)
VPDFLARLPPSTTCAGDVGSWLLVRNPAYPSDGARVNDFIATGTELLRAFENENARLQADHDARNLRTTAPLTRRINTLRQSLELDIRAAARSFGVITGKWMFFPSANFVDEMWAAIAGATARGDLGIGAKVATNDGSSNQRLIAVYTRDYEDMEDIRRVLRQLVNLKLVSDSTDSPIYYKMDGYTHLQIRGNNPYGLRASMFSSRDVLRERV